MKKLTYTTTIFMAMAATSVFAHHPSLDVNPNYEMVDDQLEAAESPHLDMDMDAMGAITAASDSIMAEATQSSAGGVTTARAGLAEYAQDQTGDAPGMDAAAAGTIDLMENVVQ